MSILLQAHNNYRHVLDDDFLQVDLCELNFRIQKKKLRASSHFIFIELKFIYSVMHGHELYDLVSFDLYVLV